MFAQVVQDLSRCPPSAVGNALGVVGEDVFSPGRMCPECVMVANFAGVDEVSGGALA